MLFRSFSRFKSDSPVLAAGFGFLGGYFRKNKGGNFKFGGGESDWERRRFWFFRSSLGYERSLCSFSPSIFSWGFSSSGLNFACFALLGLACFVSLLSESHRACNF